MLNHHVLPANDVISLTGESLQTPVVFPESICPGIVSLVGAGPGDPDLLTVKALRTIETADLIIYDRLVSDAIRQLFPATTPALYVGKAKNRHSITQDKINSLLVEKAKLGLNICRLKGGDAFVFGRGGEEMLSLKAEGIAVEIVPGITAGAGCTSYAGIPLTHRGLAQGCTFVTAHAEKSLDIHWQQLAHLNHTLVFYMGATKSEFISTNLIEAGLSPGTPAAFIENGCNTNQRVICGDLSELSQLASLYKIKSPALIVIGKVVNLADKLAWFEPFTQQGPRQQHKQQARLSA